MYSKRKSIFVGLFVSSLILLGAFYLFPLSSTTTTNDQNNDVNEAPKSHPKTSNGPIHDKVYTFEAPTHSLTLGPDDLDDEYTYYIYIELVTPHNVTLMTITVTDPDGHVYTIFEDFMCYEPEYGRYFEIPFGTSKEGDHSFKFDSQSLADVNFNMLITITKGPKCLFDVISQDNIDNLVYYHVGEFQNPESQFDPPAFHLDGDVSYKFYIARVTAIAISLSASVEITFKIQDEGGIIFTIYSDELIENIYDIKSFSFGTSTGGDYTISLKAVVDVPYTNIAISISEDFKLSGEITNDTDDGGADDDDDDDGESNKLLNEFALGTLIFSCVVAGVLVAVFMRHRKKNIVSLKTTKKQS